MPNLRVPVEWLTEGKLPPVCLLTGQPTDGHFERISFHVPREIGVKGDVALEVADAALGGVGSLGKLAMRRKLDALVPVVPGVLAESRRSARGAAALAIVVGVLFFVGPVVLSAFVEPRWAKALLVVAALVVPNVLFFLFVVPRLRGRVTIGVSDANARAFLTFPSDEAHRQIRDALIAAGGLPLKACVRCKAEIPGEFDTGEVRLAWCPDC